MKKLLIIRLSSLGDIILTTPVVRCLKLQTHADIHFLTKRQNAFLLSNNPHVDKVWAIDKDPLEIFGTVKMEHYDFVIDLHNNTRSRRLTLLLGRPAYRFPKLNIRKWLLVRFKINLMPTTHVVDRYFKAVEKLGVVNDNQGLDYYLTEDDMKAQQAIVDQFHSDYDVVVAGAKHYTKQIPLDRVCELIHSTPRPCIVLGGPDDALKGIEIGKLFHEDKVLNLCGKISFSQSVSILSRAHTVFTSDTGLMHAAAAFNRQIVVLWGNTVPALGMYPYIPNPNRRILNIENNKLSCRPCSKIGYTRCPKKHFKCMTESSLSGLKQWIDAKETD